MIIYSFIIDLYFQPGEAILDAKGAGMMITGEIYETDETNISAVDRLEGHPHIYTRQNIEKGFKTKNSNQVDI